MTRLTVTNTNISNSLTVFSRLTVNNAIVTMTPEGLTVGSNVSANSSQVTVGSTFINSSTISSPSLILGGTSWGLYKGIVDYQVFTANGTWASPYSNTSFGLSGEEQVFIMMWGGGGGGAANNTVVRTGSGAACVLGYYELSDLANTVTVTVGLGGTGIKTTTVAVGDPNIGTNSVFGSLTAYGGGAGDGGTAGGGGTLTAGNTTVSGSPLPGAVSTYGGGTSSSSGNGGISIFGGGGGSRSASGGNSVYGGAGGGSTGGTSVFGGNGGSGTLANINGSIPGGGASANAGVSGAGGNGARGEVRVWVIK